MSPDSLLLWLVLTLSLQESLQLHMVDTQEKAEPQCLERLEAHLPETSDSPEEG